MKTITTFVIFLFIILSPAIATHVFSLSAPKKITASIDFFRAHRQGNAVAMTWGTSSADIVEFVVERSDDGEFFNTIGNMASNGVGKQNFKDNTVFPGVIRYRIAAVKSDGSTEYSAVETVRIVRRG